MSYQIERILTQASLAGNLQLQSGYQPTFSWPLADKGWKGCPTGSVENGSGRTEPLKDKVISSRRGKSGSNRLDFERLTREIKDVVGLYNLAVAVGSCLNLEEVIWTLYKESSHLIDTTNFTIAIYEAETDQLSFELVFSQGRRFKPRLVKLNHNQGLIWRVLDSQAPLLEQDLWANSSIEPDQVEPEQHIRSWLGTPILNPTLPQARALGVMAMWSDEPGAFTERDLWLLSAIATQAAIALRNVRLYESLLAERDRVVEAEKQARQALARDLHDGPTQLVSAIMMHLELCKLILEQNPAQLPEELAATQHLARQAVDNIRTLLFELRPLALEMQGLAAALQVFLDYRQKEIHGATRLSLAIKTDNSDEEVTRQEEKVEAAIFAIVQEAVNNALKHAEARQVEVELGETATTIYAIVRDDGRGFEIDQVMRHYERRGSLGMINLRERAELIGGELSLHSVLGKGTQVAISVPKSEAERKKKRGATGPLSPLFRVMLEE
jgi:signal transduction histidine kinase